MDSLYLQFQTVAVAILMAETFNLNRLSHEIQRAEAAEAVVAVQRQTIRRLSMTTITDDAHTGGDEIPDAPMFNGTRQNLRGFIAQLRLKLNSSPRRFPTPALHMTYTINRLEGTALAQALPHVTATGVNLPDFEGIVSILETAFAGPDAAATAGQKLTTLRQGNEEFSVFFAEFQSYIAELNWDERAKLDTLRKALSIELHMELIGQDQPDNFNDFAAMCQSLDSRLCALKALKKSHNFGCFSTNQTYRPPAATSSSVPIALPTIPLTAPLNNLVSGLMDLSAARRTLSAEERANRMATGACLYCSQMGHIAQVCPNKGPGLHAAVTSMTPIAKPVAPQETGNGETMSR